jgi:hypothetical protein
MDQPQIQFDLSRFILLAGGAALLAVLLVILVAVARLLRRRNKPAAAPPVDLRLRVADLPSAGPATDGPRLEFYGVPVRLAALILAPAGRNNSLPPDTELPSTVDCLIPGLTDVLAAHRPVIRAWPFQLSTQGFEHAFFNNVQLPGDRGKGTPWCSVAGRFEAGSRQFLAGLLCVADRPNSLGQVTVAHVGQWMDVLRVKHGAPDG